MSGGRATVRAKAGKSTANAAGDLCAMTKEAQDLLNIVTLELKRGYNTYTPIDLIDGAAKGFNDFVNQAKKAASLAGTPMWAVVHKRDRRDALIVLPSWHGLGPNWTQWSGRLGVQVGRFEDFLCHEVRSYLKSLTKQHD